VGRALARIEKKGIPTFSITRQGFSGVVANAFLGIGLDSDAAQYEFPMEMFLERSDLTPLKENVDKIIDGLTKWQPRPRRRVTRESSKITVDGGDYFEAIAKLNVAFLRNKWGDGLGILPATEERVRWLLTGTDLPRDIVIGKIPPVGRIATVESLAVSLAMTGGRPEYMPVLIAIMRAFLNPQLRAGAMQATTCSVCPVVIVNGPIAKQIRLNSGYGCLGPDPVHPAGASIGRALRLMQQDIGGAVPGSGTMAVYGGPARYTNVVFAEDEDGLPQDWKSLSSERGFPAGSNIVTLHGVACYSNVHAPQVSTAETAVEALNEFARVMAGNYGNIFGTLHPNSVPGVVLIPRATARGLSSLGWSKERVKGYLWENSKVPWVEIQAQSRFGKPLYLGAGFEYKEVMWKPYLKEGEAWPLAADPKNIMIVVAGGEQNGHGYWMRYGEGPVMPTSAEIKLPANWGELLKKAEDDFGPLPAR